MQEATTIFISYSRDNQKEAEQICSDLKQIGFHCIKYDHKNLDMYNSHFIQSIHNADFALLLISQSYLTAQNCMFEAVQLQKEKEVQKKVLPVIVDNTEIFTTEEKVKYMLFWFDKKITLDKARHHIDDPRYALKAVMDFIMFCNIENQISAFFNTLSNMGYITLFDLKKENYRSIFTVIDNERFC